MLAKLFDVVGLHSPPNKTIQFTMRGRASEDGSRAGPGPQRSWSRKGNETMSKLRRENSNGDDLQEEKEYFGCDPRDGAEYPNLWPAEDLLEFYPFIEARSSARSRTPTSASSLSFPRTWLPQAQGLQHPYRLVNIHSRRV
jgi:hypothetical protein